MCAPGAPPDSIDFQSFQSEIDRIVGWQRQAASYDDIRHATRYRTFGRVVGLAAYGLAIWHLNPFSPVMLMVSRMGRWGLAHQVLHKSYDRIPGCPAALHSAHFGRGWRRLWDWCDWIIPAAWQHEHNVHHVHTGGPGDPDVVEANVEFLRSSPHPPLRKGAMALLIMCTWRLSYYAPSTFIQLRRHEQGLAPTTYVIKGPFMFAGVFNPLQPEGRMFWRRCILPYAMTNFLAVPILAFPFGPGAVISLLVTQMVVEVLLNFYSWALIASSHTAADLHRFDYLPRSRGEWYVHQVLGTVNYRRGHSVIGWAQAWVNYQIEHHLCPNLTLLAIERISPDIERACAAHRVPYLAEPLHRRFLKMFAIVLGTRSMRWWPASPDPNAQR